MKKPFPVSFSAIMVHGKTFQLRLTDLFYARRTELNRRAHS